MTKHSFSSRLISCLSSLKFSLYVLSLLVTIFILLQISSFHIRQPIQTPPTLLPSLDQEPKEVASNETLYLIEKMRLSVTFLPLKDLRFLDKPLSGHTWFMSSLYDKQERGEVQYQGFPSELSNGRLLCLKGHDGHDGSWNYYALAWPEALPANACLMEGLTFVSYNHYNYDNMWHGLSAIVPFVAWSLRNRCEKPSRWILYHWGEIRSKMGKWLSKLIATTYGQDPEIEELVDDRPVCFEKAIVMRHNEGGMSRERRMEVYDLIRCKARVYCNISISGRSEPQIGMTLLMRTGSRSFVNESAVIGVFSRECKKVEGCRLAVAYSDNLTFCEQVDLMSKTDVLVSPHGAQLTNMFLMDRNSSVMEFFPKGWLKLAGVGQFVYHWEASWSGMRHEGAWRDPNGEHCPYPENDRRCMSVYKNGSIGCDETHFGEWGRRVLGMVKSRKLEELRKHDDMNSRIAGCHC